MYKILHLFRISVFTEDFIKFINANFPENKHFFWIYGDRKMHKSNIKVSTYKNVTYVHYIVDKLQSKSIYEYDKIIYHGICEQSIIDCFFWNRKLLKRLYIYFWGGDKFSCGSKFQIYRKKNVVNNAHAIINIIPEERRFIRKHYNVRGKFYCAQYEPHNIIRQCDMVKDLQNRKEYTAIQIGNSATPSNDHINIMKKLVKFKDENIKIFVPLSYGDKEYADKIIKRGKELFGDKFVSITEFMAEGEYYKFLNQMDIAIFGVKRQQALGNIMSLLYLGKKVFLKKCSIDEHYARKGCHCHVEKIEKIEEMSFQEFAKFDLEKKLSNEKNMKEIFNIESVIKDWNQIFNDRPFIDNFR